MIARRTLLACAGLGLAAKARGAEASTVVYPQMDVLADVQAGYMLKLLETALARSGRRYELRPTRSQMVQSRSLLELARPDPSIDVFWTMTDPKRESLLLPVRIPIDRGLIGWRIAFVRREHQQRWKNLRKLSELAAYSAGQMHDWPDTAILRANGLPVTTSTYYQGLFDMLALGRIDYFPRSILEIGGEHEVHKHLDIEIEPHVLLHYPAPLYFFVPPSKPRLAADIERGLETLIADGSLERLFRKYFGGLIARYQLDQRVVLELKNPLLPASAPVQRKALWWTPHGG